MDVEDTLATLSVESKVGQLLHVGIGLGYLESTPKWPSDGFRDLIDDVKPGAVRVYGSHDAGPHAMAGYANTIQRWASGAGAGVPVLLSADCECGAVDVVDHGVEGYPSPMGRTAAGSTDLVETVSAAIAADTTAMGLNATHRPVADVNTNPENPVIGVRSPGSDPDTVVEAARAALRGSHRAGQIAVAKHFPGHGDTEDDSHHGLPTVTYDRETLEAVHLRPFEALVEAGVDAVMSAHVVVEAVDPDRPATLSPDVLTGVLREEIGFDGVVVTDAMFMDAIADSYGVGEAAVMAVEAGVDLVLTGPVSPADLRRARDALLDAVEEGRLTEPRLDESVRRILDLKAEYGIVDDPFVDPREARDVAGSEARRKLARESYEASFALVGSADPLPIDPDATTLVAGVREVGPLAERLAADRERVLTYRLPESYEPPAAGDGPDPATDADRASALAGAADAAVVLTHTFADAPDAQLAVAEAVAREVPTVVVALGLPRGADALPEGTAFLATYAQDRLAIPHPLPEAATDALASYLDAEHDPADGLPVE